jgi:hypothetical protein
MSSIVVALNKRSNQLQTINEVQSGSACDCKCLSCGDDFIAKKGNVVAHHFCHKDNNKLAMSCLENALHAACTKLLSERAAITLPLHRFSSVTIDHRKPKERAAVRELTSMGKEAPVLSAVLDYSYERMHPDVIATLDVFGEKHEVYFEIYANLIMLNKREKPINKHGISVVTICFDDFDTEKYTLQDIERQLSNPNNYKWLFLNGELKKQAESHWNEDHLTNPLAPSKLQSFADSLENYFASNVFFIPTHPYMEKGLGYVDLDGKFISLSSLDIPKLRQEFTISGIRVEGTMLEMSLKGNGMCFGLNIYLDYFGLKNTAEQSRFLLSVAGDFPSPDLFLTTLTWGRFQSLEEKMHAAIQDRDERLERMLREAMGRLRSSIASARSGEPYATIFPMDSGIYSNIGNCEQVFGLDQLEIQDMLLKTLGMRTPINKASLQTALRTSGVHPLPIEQTDEYKRLFAQILETYKANNVQLSGFERDLQAFQPQHSIPSEQVFLDRLIAEWAEDKVAIISGSGLVANFPYESIQSLIAHKGIWPMTARDKAQRFSLALSGK